MAVTTDPETWIGTTLTDPKSHRLGTIEGIYAEEPTGEPLWMLVRSGTLHRRHSFVPLVDARPLGGVIVTEYRRPQIGGAPRIDPQEDLPAHQVRELYRHYGLRDDVPLDAASRWHIDDAVARILPYVQ
jgi:hypothetical protein